MTDERYDEGEDRLPWLESADDDYREGPSAGRVIALILAGLLAIALLVYAFNWFRDRAGVKLSGTGELINAQDGDYKVKPDQPGGMKVEGEGDTVFATSEGGGTNGTVDTRAVPEAPIAGTAASGTPSEPGTSRIVTAIPGPGGRLTAPTPAMPAAAAASRGGGSVVQLGSFPSQAGADAAWAQLSKRFGYLAPLGKSIEPTTVGGRSYFRLRVNAGSAGNAQSLCGKLKVAGEPCFIPN